MSNPLKVALIGANGQLGTDIVSHFSAQCDRYQLTALTRADIDITQPEVVHRVLTSQKFDIVINSAAYVRVDDCEQEVATAFNVNAIAALNIARAVANWTHFVFISALITCFEAIIHLHIPNPIFPIPSAFMGHPNLRVNT